MSYRTRNQQRDQAIIHSYQNGNSLREISRAFGITHQAVAYLLKTRGIPRNQKLGLKNDPRFSAMVEMWRQTESVAQVAKTFDVSIHALYSALKRTGIRQRIDPRERFWSKVQKGAASESCWIWTGSCHRGGHGLVSFKTHQSGKSQTWYAHRLAWWLTNQSLPQKPLMLLHSCGVPSCCNPNHLRVGTCQENRHDRILHAAIGRGPDAIKKSLTDVSV